MEFNTLIGIEIHSELLTKSKAFCSCKNGFGDDVNTNVCPVCLGLPGTLPVLNEELLRYAIIAGTAMNCSIAKQTKMDRKNYFYPDLTKGYQISQFDIPLCYEGYIEISGKGAEKKKIRIIRIHMEEDTGKSIHDTGGDTLLDFNRAGVPLIEIVSYPDMNSPEEALEYLENLKEILLFTHVSDVKMEQGSFRCDININLVSEDGSIRSKIVELKNLNSFRSAYKAMQYEVVRHRELLLKGENTEKETRRWSEEDQKTISMRSKDSVQDYRYFPEPDIVNINLTDEYISNIQAQIPELPSAIRARFISDYGITEDDARLLTMSTSLSTYYEELCKLSEEPVLSFNFVSSEFLRRLNEANMSIGEERFAIEDFAYLIRQIADAKINNNAGKKVFRAMFEEGVRPDEYIKSHGLVQMDDQEEIRKIVLSVLEANPQSIEDYKNGKDRAFGFLVGQTMKQSRGKANPQTVNQLLKEEIEKL